jgi:acetyltransferase-like isoleucine patch superfamily enzyme
MRYISTIVRVLKRKIANFIAWRKYKNHTYGHFINDKLIHIGGKETYGVPLIDAYDETCHLYIGKYCSIARGVNILMGGNHHSKWVSTFAFYQEPQLFPDYASLKHSNSISKGNINIGNDVWIGRDALIITGAEIGDGAIIGAGAVVAGKIPPYSIALGNPAKVIKKRFTDNQIEALLRIKWWDWPYEKANKYISLICSENVDRFIEAATNNELD